AVGAGIVVGLSCAGRARPGNHLANAGRGEVPGEEPSWLRGLPGSRPVSFGAEILLKREAEASFWLGVSGPGPSDRLTAPSRAQATTGTPRCREASCSACSGRTAH